jgi:transposase, IS5 family
VQAEQQNIRKRLADMIRYTGEKQPNLVGFKTPFERELDGGNRWVKLGECVPWDELAEAYYRNMSSSMGRPAKDARLVIGAVIIKHKLCLSDEETIEQIRENPYLQYFVGLKEYQLEAPFVPTLFVEIRRRMGEETFSDFHQAIVNAVEKRQKQKKTAKGGTPDGPDEPDEPKQTHKGKMIVDATVAEQAVRYPTDLSLLNESREISEELIDILHKESGREKKPRTYRQKARKDYLAIVKRRAPGSKVIRRGVRQQLQYLGRNLSHISKLLDKLQGRPIPLSHRLLRKYWIIQEIYRQQNEMYVAKQTRCDTRIVSIHQPHVRPIVRGKQSKPVEFGAKLSVSLTETGLAGVDRISWEAFHEGNDLMSQVEKYKQRYGYLPEVVLADPIYGTRENRKELKDKGIRFAGKPLGRPPKKTAENEAEIKRLKKLEQEEYRQRIPIEGKFGQGKNGYGLDYIRAKTARTSEAWINSIFLVMNLMVLQKVFLLASKINALCPISVHNTLDRMKIAFVSVFNQLNLPTLSNKVRLAD